jgi:hypothetical protein
VFDFHDAAKKDLSDDESFVFGCSATLVGIIKQFAMTTGLAASVHKNSNVLLPLASTT